MATQIQCPNCGGYRIQKEEVMLDKYGRERPIGNLKVAASLLLTAFIMSISIIVLLVTQHPASDDLVVYIGAIVIALILMVACWGYIRYYANAPKKLRLECLLCGKRWKLPDDAHQAVRVRPDLIARGDQRLQDEAAAAWAYEEEQRRRRERQNRGSW